MSDGTLLFEIVDAFEKQGLGRNEYQLQRVIDVEALEQLVDSTDPHADLGIQFTVSEFRVLVTDSRVTITRM